MTRLRHSRGLEIGGIYDRERATRVVRDTSKVNIRSRIRGKVSRRVDVSENEICLAFCFYPRIKSVAKIIRFQRSSVTKQELFFNVG